jgi:GNAT superfamily N-acetyltransferase
MRSLVDAGEVPGLLAYADGVIAGWCSVAPRSRLPGLQYRQALQAIDDQPVWSIVCFFVAREFRRHGLMSELLRAALRFAREHGASIVEAYPKEVLSVELASGFRGFVSTLGRAGFVEVARRSSGEPIMRYYFAEPDVSELQS